MVSQKEVIFNGISSKIFDIVPVSINNNEESESTVISLETVNETGTRNGKPIDYGVRPDEVLSFTITFCHPRDNTYITNHELREIVSWLQPDGEFHWLTGTPWVIEPNDEEIYFLCRITDVQKYNINGAIAAVIATVTCDTWHAYSKEIVHTLNIEGHEDYSLVNNSDDTFSHVYPYISFTQSDMGLTPSYVYEYDLFSDITSESATTYQSALQILLDELYNLLYITIPRNCMNVWYATHTEPNSKLALHVLQSKYKLQDLIGTLEAKIKEIDQRYYSVKSASGSYWDTYLSQYNVSSYVNALCDDTEPLAKHILKMTVELTSSIDKELCRRIEENMTKAIQVGGAYYIWLKRQLEIDNADGLMYNKDFSSYLYTCPFAVSDTNQSYYTYLDDSIKSDVEEIVLIPVDGYGMIEAKTTTKPDASGVFTVENGTYQARILSYSVDFSKMSENELTDFLRKIRISTERTDVNCASLTIIVNGNTDMPITISNIQAGETVTIDSENDLLMSSQYIQNRYRIIGDDFSRNWISLRNGKNTLAIEGNGTLTIKYREARKVGGLL